MKHHFFGVALVGALGLSATGWAQAPATGGASANQPMTPAPTAPATPATTPPATTPPAATPPAATANQAPQANTTAKPPALASSPVCPPVHRRVAHHYYRGHTASRTSVYESGWESGEMAEGASQIVQVAPPPVYYEPPPPPPVWDAPAPPRPWYPAPWHARWWRPG